MSLETPQIYEFGNFRLDVAEKKLNRDGMPVSLTPKVFETLQVLIENAGRVVKKEELMQAIWRDRFVEESNLTFNIKMLRKALGDDASHPRFIETIPRSGYRFIAETAEVLAENRNGDVAYPLTDQDSAQNPPLSERVQKRTHFPAALLVVLLIGLVVVASWLLIVARSSRGAVAPVLSAASTSEYLSYSANIIQPRLSPDGKYLAYINNDGGDQTIWLRELETRTNFPLLPFSGDEYLWLMFSSKSDFVYFVRKPRGTSQIQTGIYRISIFGGIPTKLVSDTQGWFSLSPVDDQIAFVRYDAEKRSVLMISDADGKAERLLTTRDGGHNFRATRWSADGKSIAVAVGQAESGANDFGLMEIDVDSGKERDITSRKFFSITDLEWLPERSGVLVAARENNSPVNQIWQVSLDNGDAVKVIDDGTSYVSLSLNKAATEMAISQSLPDFRVTVANFAEPRSSFSTSAAASGSSFAPSGKIFYSDARGQLDIWTMNPDGSEKRQVTNTIFDDSHPLVSPDEKYIFFTSARTGDKQVWRMSTDGSDELQITKTEGGYPIFVSPDGRFLFYLSARKRSLWKVPVDGGEEKVFFDKRVTAPSFSPDGKYLAYFYRDAANNNSYRLALVLTDPVTEHSSSKQPEEGATPIQIAWLRDNRSFFYASSNQSKTAIWRQSLSAHAAEKIADLGGGDVVDFSVSPAGDKFAYVSGTWKREAKLVKGLQ